jgi:hypothetical protein
MVSMVLVAMRVRVRIRSFLLLLPVLVCLFFHFQCTGQHPTVLGVNLLNTSFSSFWDAYSSQQLPLSVPLNAAQIWAAENLRLIATVGTLQATIAARNLAIVNTCMYDAIVPYDAVLLQSTNVTIPKRLIAEQHNETLMSTAISFAAYRAISNLYSAYPAVLRNTSQLFVGLGYNLSDTSELLWTPQGIGNRACRGVLEERAHDGANQYGDEYSSVLPLGTNYSDYTNYYPVNDPQPTIALTNCSQLRSRNTWQPLNVTKPGGGYVIQSYVTPQFSEV